ncbi:hypothetical protein EOD42_25420 [Rhodovarius crocodyli]|uniref:Uncharacterized protein n=2 Tax=Rhodovarius crocodyli TaxID=1979269 RepID=A0A437LV22_9PROT|nr:hypothetical protein EOD42_25420 [Rhodovarius crocodyli]
MLGRDPWADVPKLRQRRSAKAEKMDAAILTGLPALTSITWLQAQLWDNGVGARGGPRWNLKVKWTTIRPELIDRGRIASVRYAGLSTIDQWRDATKRRRNTKAWETAFCKHTVKVLREIDRARPAGSPEVRVGSISYRYSGHGTIVYPGQVAVLSWDHRDGEWLPCIGLYQAGDDGDGKWVSLGDGIDILLNSYREAEGRREGASDYVGLHYRDDYRALLIERREMAEAKAEKASK